MSKTEQKGAFLNIRPVWTLLSFITDDENKNIPDFKGHYYGSAKRANDTSIQQISDTVETLTNTLVCFIPIRILSLNHINAKTGLRFGVTRTTKPLVVPATQPLIYVLKIKLLSLDKKKAWFPCFCSVSNRNAEPSKFVLSGNNANAWSWGRGEGIMHLKTFQQILYFSDTFDWLQKKKIP